MRIHSSRRRGAFAVSAAALAALVLAGCSTGSASPTSSDSGTPYQILVLGAVSTPNGATSILAAQAGAAAQNKLGGIGGRQITVTVSDDKGDPTTAVTAVREAINSSTPPDLVLNSGPSTIANATLPIIGQAGILSMNIGPTQDSSNPATYPLNFDISPGPTEYMKGFVAELKAKGYKNVGILHGSSSYGESFGTLSQEALTAAGFTITSNQEYDVKALDMTPQLQTIQATNPDVLVLDAYGAPLGYVLQGVQKLGWNVPIVGDNSVAATPLVATDPPTGVLGTPAVQNLTMEVFTSTKLDPSATLVNDAVKEMASLGQIQSTLILAYNYDAPTLIAAAAAKAGTSTDAKAIATALEDPSVTASAKTAILTNYKWSSTSHAPDVDASEFLFIAPSKIVNGQFQ